VLTHLSHHRLGSIHLRPLATEDYPETSLRLSSVHGAEAFLGPIRVLEYSCSLSPLFHYSYALKPAVELQKKDGCEGLKMMLMVEGSLELQDSLTENCRLQEGRFCLFRSVEYKISLPENTKVQYLLFSVDPLVKSLEWGNFEEGRYDLTPRMRVYLAELLQPPKLLGTPEKWLSMQLIQLLYQLCEVTGQNGSETNQPTKDLAYALAADAYIQRNLEQDFTTKQLSLIVGLNECNLKKAYTKLFNVGMGERQNELRIELGKRLLLETDKPISEIAFICGYSNDDTFRVNFKKFEVLTPADWRKKFKI
jgi:AraC-like DNA-binding protein